MSTSPLYFCTLNDIISFFQIPNILLRSPFLLLTICCIASTFFFWPIYNSCLKRLNVWEMEEDVLETNLEKYWLILDILVVWVPLSLQWSTLLFQIWNAKYLFLIAHIIILLITSSFLDLNPVAKIFVKELNNLPFYNLLSISANNKVFLFCYKLIWTFLGLNLNNLHPAV